MVDNEKRTARTPPALNPEQLALTQPWKDFVSLGLIVSLKATFTPGGTQVQVDISEAVPNATIRTGLAPGVAKQLIIASGLAPAKGKKGDGKKKEEPLPVRSLCAKDIEDATKFSHRLAAVCKKLGPSTALGRIGSLKMHIDSVTTFEDWWYKAKQDDKARLVMDKKHLDGLTEAQKSTLFNLLKAADSPFRGSFPENSLDNEKKEEKSETAPKEGKRPAPAKGKAGPSKK